MITKIETKLCPVCETIKPITAFALRKDMSGNRRRYLCNPCKYKKYGDWKKANPDKAKIIQRRVNLKRSWGMTPESFAEKLAGQNGVCAICKLPSTRRCHRTNDLYPLVVDHDHNTGQIRGLLCDKCNRAIGLFGDNKETLESALQYLDEWGPA